MRHVAITGGIGSGKSYVSELLSARGISVYDCDAAAKRLMREDAQLKMQLQALVGPEVYLDGALQKSVLAQFLLSSEQHKQAVNDVVHPAVARDYLESGLEWLESAILFESGFDKRLSFDVIVCVTAPLEVRIQRVMSRDRISREQALAWIGVQMSQEEVARRCQYVIDNDGQKDLNHQINDIINQLYNNRNGNNSFNSR